MDKVQMMIELDRKDYEELNTFYILNLGTEAYRKIIEKHCLDAIRHGKPYELAAERPQGECKTCQHRDPEDKKCDCGALERAGCMFPVSDDYFCKFYEKGGTE